jgi:hypothetical protein
MRNLGKRASVVLGMGLFAVPLVTVGLAYACTGLATVSSSPGSGTPGSTVTITGKGFVAHDPSDARTSPAQIRLDSMDGPVLGSASPAGGAAGGSFSVNVTVPQVAPGDHVLVVTQTGTDGRPAYGTPARQAFTVLPAPPAVEPSPVVQPIGTLPVAAAAPPQAAPTAVTALAAPATSSASRRAASLRRALAGCNRRFAARKARTRAGRTKLAKRRAACRTQARRRLSA